MEIPELAIDKESQNLYYIYLFYVEDKWCAFGYSAYYLSIMYPVLEAGNETTGGMKRASPVYTFLTAFWSDSLNFTAHWFQTATYRLKRHPQPIATDPVTVNGMKN